MHLYDCLVLYPKYYIFDVSCDRFEIGHLLPFFLWYERIFVLFLRILTLLPFKIDPLSRRAFSTHASLSNSTYANPCLWFLWIYLLSLNNVILTTSPQSWKKSSILFGVISKSILLKKNLTHFVDLVLLSQSYHGF